MEKNIFIIPYFGKLPDYFDLWYQSAIKQQNSDFLFFTDISELSNYSSENIFIKQITFSDLQERIQGKFDFSISLDNPYKLCDYKTAYGYIFEEFIRDYDYWGYCDIDLVFGSLDKHINLASSTEKFDRIGNYGHLSLYKNTTEFRMLFQSSGAVYSYEEVYSNPYIYGFDEMAGMNLICTQQNINTYSLLIGDISPIYKNYKDARDDSRYQLFTIEDGSCYKYSKITNESEIEKTDLTYIHFQKKNPKVPVNFNLHERDYYFIAGDVKEVKQSIDEVIDNVDFNSRECKKEQRNYKIRKIIQYLKSDFKQVAIRMKNNKYIKNDLNAN